MDRFLETLNLLWLINVSTLMTLTRNFPAFLEVLDRCIN